MIDGVELVMADQLQQMGEFHGDHPPVGQQQRQTSHEIVDGGDMGQHIVGDDQLRPPALGGQFPGRLLAEEGHPGGNIPLIPGHRRHVGRRLHPQYRHPQGPEILQQITVVAGDLHHQGAFIQGQLPGDGLGIAAGMIQPTAGIGGKIRVVCGKQFIRCVEILQLHQPAFMADPGLEGIEGLPPLQFLGPAIVVRRWLQPQIDKGM